MSYGNYGRYGSSGYSSYSGSSRRPASSYTPSTSSYVPSYTRRSSGGSSYGLMHSLSSSYLSPNSSPRSSISLGSARELRSSSYGGSTRLDYTPEQSGYKLSSSKSSSSLRSDDGDCSEGQTERTRHRYGSSTSLPDSASEMSSRSETPSRYSSLGSRTSLNEDDKDYKKLYEELRKENERLKETLKKTEEELEKTKKQLQKLSQNNSSNKNSERRALERKLAEMEEELKSVLKLKTENEKLKAENRALSRVVCKLTK